MEDKKFNFLLSDLFSKLAKRERSVELKRQFLCEAPGFSLPVAFSILDPKNYGSILPSSIYKFLLGFGINPSEVQIYLLVKTFDSSCRGSLSFDDFESMAVSKVSNQVQESSPKAMNFGSKAVEQALAKLLQKEINFQWELELIKEALHNLPDWSILRAFRCFDTSAKGFITQGDVMRFFEETGTPITYKDLEAIMLRADKDKDSVINYRDFIEFIVPIRDQNEVVRPRSNYKTHSLFVSHKRVNTL